MGFNHTFFIRVYCTYSTSINTSTRTLFPELNEARLKLQTIWLLERSAGQDYNSPPSLILNGPTKHVTNNCAHHILALSEEMPLIKLAVYISTGCQRQAQQTGHTGIPIAH